jgi:ribosome-associated translation inhibitor RaiA
LRHLLQHNELSRIKMQIRVHADEHIDSSEELTIRVEGVVEGSLDHYRDRVSLVEVHLSRRSPHHPGERDMCCRMEAHAGALKPIEVSHEALTLTEAIHAASAKLERAIHAYLGGRRSKTVGVPAAEAPAEGVGHLRSS